MARLDPRKPTARTHARLTPAASPAQDRPLTGGAERTSDDSPVEVSSPVCYVSEAPVDYMGYLGRDAMIEQLNVLLEAERAGARVGARLVADADDPELKALARTIRADEGRWCRMLIDALTALGATPSQTVGAFYGKAMAIGDVEARIAFLNRGQSWVVRKLTAMLPQVRDDVLHGNLSAMLVAHERNIERAASTLKRRAAANSPASLSPS